MKLIANVLVCLGYVWVTVSVVFIVISYGLIVYWEGFGKLAAILSPFNI